DHRPPGRHRLQGDEPERLIPGRNYNAVELRIKRLYMLLKTGQRHAFCDRMFLDSIGHELFRLAVTNHNRASERQPGESTDHILCAFTGLELSNVPYDEIGSRRALHVDGDWVGQGIGYNSDLPGQACAVETSGDEVR